MHTGQFYVGGEWVDPLGSERITVVDPATEEPCAEVAAAGPSDIDRAVAAARAAFPDFAASTREQRLAFLESFLRAYEQRADDIAHALSQEMGAPFRFARDRHIPGPVRHFRKMIEVLREFRFEEMRGTTLVVREPIGVCGLITPWNWPLVQIACKLAPAIAAGCTSVLKPSEVSPLSGLIIAEVLHEAGLPPGVCNLVNGTGPVAGEALAAHPDVDMVSFTGSTRAGIRVAKVAADTVKRVHQELGGKSANIVLPDADLEPAVTTGVLVCFKNSGQSCNAPTRLLVPAARQEEAAAIAKRAAESLRVGPAADPAADLGPVANAVQFERVQAFIQRGMQEGARLVTGGPGRPEGINRGYYVRPTVFADMRSDMAIAREEIFGPVIGIQPYRDVDDAIAIANDSVYGLAAYVQSADLDAARRVAARLRTGTVQVNYPAIDPGAPFGGYRQSGNGREYAEFGLAEFLEIKAVLGYAAA
ncbi:MAG: aldehyde dehydrogenase family protein [Acidisphaera sp.]|nr:aldehyde dehydrogenase family protein [Acidisphaera sp.]